MTKAIRNINDEVIVKLTTAGEKIYTENAFGHRQLENQDHIYSFQLWEFAYIFGKHLHMLGPQLIVNNKIVFPDMEKYNIGEYE